MPAGFDLLKCRNPLAFQIPSPCFGKMRFSHETILDAQRFFHRVAKVLLNLTGCHLRKFNSGGRLGQDRGGTAVTGQHGLKGLEMVYI